MTDGCQAQRVAVITGGGSGIGRATALRLARDGADVTVVDRDAAAAGRVAAEVRDSQGRATAVTADVADGPAVRAVVEGVARRAGRLDILVTAAGHSEFVDFDELTVAAWDRMIAVHLTGAFHCVQSAVSYMRPNRYGRIVLVSSAGAMSGGSGRVPHYAAAKAGLIGLAKGLARDLAASGVTINCVAPGAVDTPMLRGVAADLTRYATETPVGRIGTPEDVADAILYLCGEGAGFVTGWVLAVTGGRYL